MEIKVSKIANSYGYYGLSFFENGKFNHFVMKSFEDCLLFIADKSNYSAELSFNGSKFQVWSY